MNQTSSNSEEKKSFDSDLHQFIREDCAQKLNLRRFLYEPNFKLEKPYREVCAGETFEWYLLAKPWSDFAALAFCLLYFAPSESQSALDRMTFWVLVSFGFFGLSRFVYYIFDFKKSNRHAEMIFSNVIHKLVPEDYRFFTTDAFFTMILWAAFVGFANETLSPVALGFFANLAWSNLMHWGHHQRRWSESTYQLLERAKYLHPVSFQKCLFKPRYAACAPVKK